MPPEAAISGFEEFLAEHSALLKLLHTQASAARWNVSCEEFAAALYRSAAHHLAAAPGETAEKYFGALHLEDLALACALRNGSEPAWEQFVSQYRPILRAAARAIVGQGGQGGQGARAARSARENSPIRSMRNFTAWIGKAGSARPRCSTTFTGAASFPRGCARCWHSGTWTGCGIRGARSQSMTDRVTDRLTAVLAGRSRWDGHANAAMEEMRPGSRAASAAAGGSCCPSAGGFAGG